MDLLSSHPLWPELDGPVPTFRPLARNARCDVAVIGGGISGALVAWHLAEAGVDTIVLDRRDLAQGSTAGNTGLLLYEIDVPLHQLAARFGFESAARIYRRCSAAIGDLERIVQRLDIACGFARRPSLFVAANRAHLPRLRREFEARRRAGLAVKWWSRAKLMQESTLPYPAAIRSSVAAQVDPYRLTYGLLAAARHRGARVYPRTEVTRRRVDQHGVELHIAGGATVRARDVVLASGYEADASLSRRATALHSTFAIASQPLAAFPGWPADGALIWETRQPYLYLRTTADRRIIIGGYDEPFRDPRARDQILPAKAAALERRVRQLFPDIPFERAAAWAGTFADTTDGLPFIGRHPEVPHTWFALGYGGNGTTFSLIAAEIIREGILNRQDPDGALFGFERNAAR